MNSEVKRLDIRFTPDPRRVLIRPFVPLNPQRISNILARLLTLTEEEVDQQLCEVCQEFSGRHQDINRIFKRHFEKVKPHLFIDRKISQNRKQLIGSFFTSEYALESAALFNPSIVPHPDQSGIPVGSLRIILSLRATGEGHISSIEFRSAVLDSGCQIKMDPVTRFVTEPEMFPNPTYDKATFVMKLHEMGFQNNYSTPILESLGETFELSDLRLNVAKARKQIRIRPVDENRALDCIEWLAQSNYEVYFPEELPLCERIIFPVSANESNGIEDARFVKFTDDDGSITYYATYTAYNGRVILPQLIETKDFLHFKVITLNGQAAQNKGMALFPRKIGGRYAMISRQDNENLYVMFSENLHFWHETQKLMKPAFPWEFVQLGNCGSPIETEDGWLLLTHGVGAMRKYCLGAILLDREDPGLITGRLSEPLMEPDQNEREGYVPNVVYTCGALVHNDTLVIPYAMSDSASSIAVVPVRTVLDALKASPPV